MGAKYFLRLSRLFSSSYTALLIIIFTITVPLISAWHHPGSDFHPGRRMYYKNPRNVPADYCPRDEAAAALEGRTCLRKCVIDEDCKSKRKKCMCDGVCGLSCLNPERECGEPEPPDGPGGVKTTGKSFGSKAIYSCPVNSHLIGVSERTCQADGTWSSNPPSCNKAIFCADAPRIANARHSSPIDQRAFALDTTLQYQCHPGYISKGFPEAKCLLYHNGTAKWFGPDFTCEPITCGPPSDILNGRRDGFCDHFLCRVTYVCQPGFEIVGKAHRTCQQNGSWTPEDPPLCTPIQCAPPKNPANGKAVFTSIAFNSLVSYECKYGYMLVGENQRRCGPHKQWTGLEPMCKEINCGSPGNGILYNGWIEGTRTTLHAVVIFHCLEGMKFDGPFDRIVCQSDGTWSGPMPKCQSPCEIPEIQFGNVSGSNTNSTTLLTPRTVVPHGTAVGVTCDEHYEPVFNITPPTCHNGTWTHPPRCQPARCKSLPRPPRHGMVIAPKTEHSMKARYTCRDGYNLIGNNITECQYGVWQGEAPSCQITYCKYLPPPEHGRVLLVGNMGLYDYRNYVTKVANNRQIMFECDRGYVLAEGPQGKTCIRGEWAPKTDPPRCLPSKHPSYRYRRSLRAKRRAIKTGGSNVLRNRAGGGGGGALGPRRIVKKKNKNGEEEEYEVSAAPFCDREPLENEYIMTELIVLGEILGDEENATTYSQGATLKVSCVQGFGVNLANETVRCVNGRWKPKAPQCNALPCRTPYIQHGTFHNGSKALYFLEHVKSDMKLELKCSKGYVLRGKSAIICHYGEWETDDFPECVPVPCTLPHIDHGDYYDGHQAGSEVAHGTEVDYTCGKHKKLSPGPVTCHLGGFKPVKPMCLHPNVQLNYTSAYADSRKRPGSGGLFPSKRSCGPPPSYNASVAYIEGKPILEDEYIFADNTEIVYRCGPMKPKRKLRYKVVCQDRTANETGARHPCADEADISQIEELRKSLNRTCAYYGDDEWELDSKYHEDKNFSFYNNTDVIVQCGTIKPKNKTTKTRWKMVCEDGNWTGTPLPCEGELDYELIDQMLKTINGSCVYRGDAEAVATFYYDQHLNSEETHFPSGSLLVSRCSDIGKYQMSGSTRRKCISGIWLGMNPKCHGNSQLQDYALGKSPTILFRYANGSIVQSNDGKLVVYTGTTLHMECLWIRKYGKPAWENPYTKRLKDLEELNKDKDPKDHATDPSIRVYKEGWVTEEGRDASLEYRLTIESAQEEDSGQYTCVTPSRHRHSVEIQVRNTECKPLPEHPELMYSTTAHILGTRVNFTCRSDNVVVGAQELICMASGNWSAPLPRCVDVECPDISLLPATVPLAYAVSHDGTMQQNETAPPKISVFSRRVNGKAIFSCPPGFRVQGSSEAVCQANGNWSNDIPLCREVECPEPKSPINGSVISKPPYKAGDPATFECDTGYRMEGQPLVVCLDTGNWSRTDSIKCVRACTYPGTTIGGTINVMKYYYSVDESLTYGCQEGYELQGERILKCLKNGKWSSSIPVCKNLSAASEDE